MHVNVCALLPSLDGLDALADRGLPSLRPPVCVCMCECVFDCVRATSRPRWLGCSGGQRAPITSSTCVCVICDASSLV